MTTSSSSPAYTLYYKKDIHSSLRLVSNKGLCVIEDKWGLEPLHLLCKTGGWKNNSVCKIRDQKEAWLYINRLAHLNLIGHTKNSFYYYRQVWGFHMTGVLANHYYKEGEGDFANFRYKKDKKATLIYPKITKEKQAKLLEDYKMERMVYDLEKRYNNLRLTPASTVTSSTPPTPPPPCPPAEPVPKPPTPPPSPPKPPTPPPSPPKYVPPNRRPNYQPTNIPHTNALPLRGCKLKKCYRYPKCQYGKLCHFLHEDDTEEDIHRKKFWLTQTVNDKIFNKLQKQHTSHN